MSVKKKQQSVNGLQFVQFLPEIVTRISEIIYIVHSTLSEHPIPYLLPCPCPCPSQPLLQIPQHSKDLHHDRHLELHAPAPPDLKDVRVRALGIHRDAREHQPPGALLGPAGPLALDAALEGPARLILQQPLARELEVRRGRRGAPHERPHAGAQPGYRHDRDLRAVLLVHDLPRTLAARAEERAPGRVIEDAGRVVLVVSAAGGGGDARVVGVRGGGGWGNQCRVASARGVLVRLTGAHARDGLEAFGALGEARGGDGGGGGSADGRWVDDDGAQGGGVVREIDAVEGRGGVGGEGEEVGW